jgi:hypothetical protein
MTGSRLLAIFWLILFGLIFTSLPLVVGSVARGQDAAAVRADDRDLSELPLRQLISTPRVFPQPQPQPRPPTLPPRGPVTITLPQIVHDAGIIFSGRVSFVGRASSPFGQNAASTTVIFQVEHAIRGTSQGRTLTIHEWAGLWNSGERYRVGERVLLFLYPPSRLGLTSPVAGASGRFSIDGEGRLLINPQNAAILAADPLIRGRTIVPLADFVQALRHEGEAFGEADEEK